MSAVVTGVGVHEIESNSADNKLKDVIEYVNGSSACDTPYQDSITDDFASDLRSTRIARQLADVLVQDCTDKTGAPYSRSFVVVVGDAPDQYVVFVPVDGQPLRSQEVVTMVEAVDVAGRDSLPDELQLSVRDVDVISNAKENAERKSAPILSGILQESLQVPASPSQAT